MRQEEYIDKINSLIEEIVKPNRPVHERWTLAEKYANLLDEMIDHYPNDATFNFLLNIVRKLYDRRINSDYDDFKAVDITFLGLYNFFSK